MKQANRKAQTTRLFQGVCLALIGILTLNVLYLSITGKHLISGENIADYANNVRSETVKTIAAARGNIYSYDGDLIATDRVAYNVIAYLSKDRPGYGDTPAYVDEPKKAAEALSHYITNRSYEQILDILTKEGLYQYIFRCGLSRVQVENLQNEIEQSDLHGLEFVKTASRTYQYSHFSSYVIGMVNTDDEDPSNIVRDGILGVEATYNELLNGIDGKSVYQADKNGFPIYSAQLSYTDAIDGADVYLSFDSELQNSLELLMDNLNTETGSTTSWCGIMDAHTGRMLAMVSRPDFNLQDRDSITNFTDNFMNYNYEVGSCVKPFVYLTAMDEGVYNGEETYMSGQVTVKDSGGLAVRDWNSYGWGEIPYDEGLIRSSNTAIVRLIQEKGINEALLRNYHRLGFFEDDEVDGIYAEGGWAAYENTESFIDAAEMGFGQAASFSGYEIMRAFSLFANDGKIVEPYFVDHVVDKDGNVIYTASTKMTEQIFKPDDVKHVRALLDQVVNNRDIGTGSSYRSDDIRYFGKTGTGQIWDTEHNYWYSTRYSYSFAGGAPYEDPQIVFCIGMDGEESAQCSKHMGEVLHAIVPQALAKLNNAPASPDNKQYTDFKIGSYVNQSVAYAKRRLEAVGIAYEVIGDGKVVVDQSPEYNTTISTAGKVFLMSDGQNFPLPDFTGWARKEIATYLSYFNIQVNFTGSGACTGQSVEEDTQITDIESIEITLE